ncbi:DUF6879 family protein [Streptomyces sp. NPDC054901]
MELRDDYSVPDEDDPFADWMRGVVDNSYMEPWTSMIWRVADQGKIVRRIFVVTEPHSLYVYWEYATTPVTQHAGEDTRRLPRHGLPPGLTFPVDGNDWWLFDDRILAVGHFDKTGRVPGSELIEDSDVVAECVRVRDLLWASAVAHREYKP